MDQKKFGSFLRELRKEKTVYPGTTCRVVWSNKPQCVKVGDRQQYAGSQYFGGAGRFL